MFYDLHVPWKANVIETQHTIAFLHELGYNVIALSYTVTGKLSSDLSCNIPAELPFKIPPKLKILRRCTLIFSDPSQNHRLSQLAASYDILALRPTNEKSLVQACGSFDCDIISMDLTQRFEFYFKMKMLAPAIERGVKIEICYSPGILSADNNARRNLISNATQLIRATRGRGLIISSEASRAIGCRGPIDVINLAAVWGLGQERGREAVTKNTRSAVVGSQLKRTSFRGVIDVIHGGNKPTAPPQTNQHKSSEGSKKRKADVLDTATVKPSDKPLAVSKREQKRQRKALFETQEKTSQETQNLPYGD